YDLLGDRVGVAARVILVVDVQRIRTKAVEGQDALDGIQVPEHGADVEGVVTGRPAIDVHLSVGQHADHVIGDVSGAAVDDYTLLGDVGNQGREPAGHGRVRDRVGVRVGVVLVEEVERRVAGVIDDGHIPLNVVQPLGRRANVNGVVAGPRFIDRHLLAG